MKCSIDYRYDGLVAGVSNQSYYEIEKRRDNFLLCGPVNKKSGSVMSLVIICLEDMPPTR